MTAYQVGNCLATVITDVVNVPRIMISLLWKPKMYREMEVMVVISLLSTWVDDILNYDVLRDPEALNWHEKAPQCNGITEVMCYLCGDIAHKPQGVDVPGCTRCHDCEVCENCLCNIGKIRVCLRCVDNDEIENKLAEAGKRRLSMFYQDEIDFKDLPAHRRR